MHEIKTEKVFGLKVSVFTDEQLKSLIVKFISSRQKKVFFGYSLVLLPKFKEYPEIFLISDKFDVFLADGKGMYWIFRLAGVPLKSDISLPDLAVAVLKIADENKFSVMLLGASDEVNKEATENIRNEYPGAKIFDGIDGYFSEADEDKIVNKINDVKPDILLIGISSPKKEKFVENWKEKLDTSMIIPCGGVIDVLAKRTKREPLIIKKTGMTWLYRFLQEPKRLFKPIFVNGLSVIFFLLPKIFFDILFKTKQNFFSIPEYYGIKIQNTKANI